MGARIVELAKSDAGLEVVGAFDIGEDAEVAMATCDCVIEFTSPQATIEHLDICQRLGKSMVIGTTGLPDADRDTIRAAGSKIPIVLSPNMSVGVNLLFRMVADAVKVLGHDYRVGILEAHHQEKKDAPSGTAKELARLVREAIGGGHIPIESIREDDIVGEHTITFESDVDLIEITHSAKTRDIFAQGALKAAKYLAGKQNGLYTMQDVLSI
jgi:4-hydroxy-tetrahydrodipicolinate reductase